MFKRLFEDLHPMKRGLSSREGTLFDQLLIVVVFRRHLRAQATQSEVKDLAKSLKASCRELGWNRKTADRLVNFGAKNYLLYRPKETEISLGTSIQEVIRRELNWCLSHDVTSISDLEIHCSGAIEQLVSEVRSLKIE
ncbi:hypothetical protein SAMN05444851_0917 [Aliiroseovarius sediminilitoris]|uniref:Uncharacterized protein n=1 Tax=Aliiroseovarius sediminilitoris TaxID=1173584 RepID=A0A1I0NL89_9RHOB|nr:hypothetical protein [Aliiroseovarius sediminilitoris]SEW02092.1 hypothetical protein SAMN05444851_0917 [Aliiroseovarius sediminilitoris]